MTEQEIEALIANQLKAWLMHEPSWCRDGVRDSKGFADFTEKRAKDGGYQIARNLETGQMCHKYLADRGKLPT
jgi:hypothetical protein